MVDENVLNAIRLAKEKGKHSDFFIKLCLLNEKIFVYRKIFMDKRPKYIVNNPLVKTKEPKRKIKAFDSKPLTEIASPAFTRKGGHKTLSPSLFKKQINKDSLAKRHSKLPV